MKRIMFVGAGKFQLKGILKAKKLGLYTIATDGDPDAPGLKICHQAYIVDVYNRKKNLEIARKNHINAVVTIASEISVKTVAYLSQKLKLPGISVKTAENCTDKEKMRKAFRQYGVPTPKSKAVLTFKELYKQAEAIGFPVVIKPADNAGSRGVQKVDRIEDLRKAFNIAMGYSKKHKVLVEEFMEGVESSVEAFAYNNKINIIALSDKIRTPPPYLLDTTVIFPSHYPLKIQQKMIEITKKAIKAVGINIGPVHLEMMMTKKGPIPVELAARGPGAKVFTDILPKITGIDLLKETIITYLGRKPRLTVKKQKSAAVLKLLHTNPGVVMAIRNLDKVRQIPGLYEAEVSVNKKDIVRPLTCGDDRIGHLISFAPTTNQAINIINKAEKILKIITQP